MPRRFRPGDWIDSVPPPEGFEPQSWFDAQREFWSALASGQIAFDGDFGGPGWSAGAYQNSVRSYITARSAQDQRSKEHDAAYADVGPNGAFTDPALIDADWKYAKDSIGTGLKNSLAGLAVGAQGVARSAVRSATGTTGKKRFRDEDPAAIYPIDPSKVQRTTGLTNWRDIKHNFDIHKHDMDVGPDGEIEEEPQGGEAAGVGKAAGSAARKGTETAIMRPPKRIRWNLPDYNHAKLVYCFYSDQGTCDTAQWNTTATDITINMNGCHDILETAAQFTAFRDNFTVSTTVDSASATNQPRGWAYWKAIYEKYTVLNCEYDITGILFNSSPNDTDDPVAGSIDGSDKPFPQYWFGNEIGAASNDYNTSALVIMQDLGIKHHEIQYVPNTGWESNAFGATNDLVVRRRRNAFTHTFKGHANQATYEKFAREVTDDDTNTIWTNVTANPSLVHRLKLGVRPIGALYTSGERVIWSGRLIYTVQFRQKIADMHGYRMELIPGSTTDG